MKISKRARSDKMQHAKNPFVSITILFLVSAMVLLFPYAVSSEQTWTSLGTGGLGDTNNFSGQIAIYDGNLVVGTSNTTTGAMVYKYSGGTWTPISVGGLAIADNNWIMSMIVFNDQLYIGTENDAMPGYGTVYRYTGTGKNWEMCPFLKGSSRAVTSMASGKGWLFAVGQCANVAYIHASTDGVNWRLINNGTVGTLPGAMRHIDSLCVVGDYLYFGGVYDSGSSEIGLVGCGKISDVVNNDLQVDSTSPGNWFNCGGFQSSLGSPTIMTKGPNDQLAVGTFKQTGASICSMSPYGDWKTLYTAGNDFSNITSLFWDGSASYVFSTNIDLAGQTGPCQLYSMSTQGTNVTKLAVDGFGNTNNNSISSTTALYGYPGSGLSGGSNENFFTVAQNWNQGIEVWSTRLEPPNPQWYFAEGYTGPGFEQWLTILNPSTTATANVLIDYMFNNEANPSPQYVEVAPASRYTINVNSVIGENHEVSMVVSTTNGVDIFAERPIYFQNFQPRAEISPISGGHCVTGARFPSTIWYLAEGATQPGFYEYITLQNPNEDAANIAIEYSGKDGVISTKTMDLPGLSRSTVNVMNDVPPNNDVSAKVESKNNVPIIAERPMYFPTGGHCVVGAPSLASNLYFGEGYTDPNFTEWLLLQNPGDTEIDVEINFLIKGENTVKRTGTIPPRTRHTINVGNEVGSGKEVGAAISASGGIMAERAVYFTYKMNQPSGGTLNIQGGHDVVGANFAKEFYFAEGYTGTTWDEYLTIANPGDDEIKVTIQFMLEGEANPEPIDVMIPGNSRETVTVKDHISLDKNVSCRITSADEFIAERPMYFLYQDRIPGGHCVIGVEP